MAAAWPAHDRIPYRIEIVDGPVVRCWEPRDTSLLKDAIDESLWHLRPWMPWAHDEPQSRDEKVALLRSFRGRFDLGEQFVYGIFSADESAVLGGAGLHPRAGDGALEIGYWVRADHVRRGIGTAVAAALTKVGIELGNAERIEICVEVGNDASAAIPRRLGFHEEAILQRRLPAAGGGSRRDAIVFSVFADELDGSPAAGSRYLAFDSAGSPIA
jgi:RimJ/RimL family protein N-acetyltransferase